MSRILPKVDSRPRAGIRARIENYHDELQRAVDMRAAGLVPHAARHFLAVLANLDADLAAGRLNDREHAILSEKAGAFLGWLWPRA